MRIVSSCKSWKVIQFVIFNLAFLLNPCPRGQWLRRNDNFRYIPEGEGEDEVWGSSTEEGWEGEFHILKSCVDKGKQCWMRLTEQENYKDGFICSEGKKNQRKDHFLMLFAPKLEEWHHIEFSYITLPSSSRPSWSFFHWAFSVSAKAYS